MFELKTYLNAINYSKEKLMDGEDEMWEKKYPAYIVNKCVAPFQDTIFLVNEMNRSHHIAVSYTHLTLPTILLV